MIFVWELSNRQAGYMNAEDTDQNVFQLVFI